MDTVASSARGPKQGNPEETPFPFELEIVARRKRVVHREGRSQDETAPFPLEFEVVARKAEQSQDETSPFLLEFMVVLPGGESAFVRTARPPRSQGAKRSSRRSLPRLKWHGLNASLELREYAARIAAGESLPPYRGPILENGELPPVRSAAKSELPRLTADDSKAFVKLALGLMVASALAVGSALIGNDAQLRSVGQTISDWFAGKAASSLMSEPAPAPAIGPSAQR